MSLKKVFLSLLNFSLFLFPLSAHDSYGRREGYSQTAKRLKERIEVKHREKFEQILDLYREQIDHQTAMIDLTKKRIEEWARVQQLNDNQFLEYCQTSFERNSGVSPELFFSDKAADIPFGFMLEDCLAGYQRMQYAFKNFISLRTKKPGTLYEIALIYCRACCNMMDGETTIQDLKQRIKNFIKNDTNLTAEELDGYPQLRIFKDRQNLYKRVKQKILEEFKGNLEEIYNYMIIFAHNELKESTIPVSWRQFYHTQEHKQFYQSIIDRQYEFPKDFGVDILPVEEKLDQPPLKLSKSKRKRDRRKGKKETITTVSNQPPKEEQEGNILPSEIAGEASTSKESL